MSSSFVSCLNSWLIILVTHFLTLKAGLFIKICHLYCRRFSVEWSEETVIWETSTKFLTWLVYSFLLSTSCFIRFLCHQVFLFKGYLDQQDFGSLFFFFFFLLLLHTPLFFYLVIAKIVFLAWPWLRCEEWSEIFYQNNWPLLLSLLSSPLEDKKGRQEEGEKRGTWLLSLSTLFVINMRERG